MWVEVNNPNGWTSEQVKGVLGGELGDVKVIARQSDSLSVIVTEAPDDVTEESVRAIIERLGYEAAVTVHHAVEQPNEWKSIMGLPQVHVVDSPELVELRAINATLKELLSLAQRAYAVS